MHFPRQKEPTLTGRSLLQLHTLGAAHAVTGSLFLYKFVLDGKVTNVLVDVGSTVEDPKADFQRRLPAGVTAADIHFIIISHAHADHCGYLPKLVKDGFKGKVFVTPATADLMSIILWDSAHLQIGTAKRLNKQSERFGRSFSGKSRHQHGKDNRHIGEHDSRAGANFGKSKRLPYTPLYNETDVIAALKLLVPVDYHMRRRITPDIAFTFTDAGHILGSAVVNLEFGSGSDKRTFCFTGNVGRRNMPLLRDVEPVLAADYLMLEATYGNKLHEKRNRLDVLAKALNEGYKRGKRYDPKYGCGTILIPSFAVGRGQTILNDIRILMEAGRVPNMPVFVDGPMINASTEVYQKYPAIMNDETRKLLEAGKNPYAPPRYAALTELEQSNRLHLPSKEPIIVIASSGMAAGGRIVNHLQHWLPGPRNTVIFVGYQGENTLGRKIVGTAEGQQKGGANAARRTPGAVKIHGELVTLGAKIEFVSDYSAHGDYEDQLAWLKKFKKQPKGVFIVHGDEDGLTGLKGHIRKNLGWRNVTIPNKNQVFEL